MDAPGEDDNIINAKEIQMTMTLTGEDQSQSNTRTDGVRLPQIAQPHTADHHDRGSKSVGD